MVRAVGNVAREVVDDTGVDVSGLPGVAVAARLPRYGFGDPVEWLRLGYALGVSVGCEAVEPGGSGGAPAMAQGPEAAGAVHVAESAPGPLAYGRSFPVVSALRGRGRCSTAATYR